MNLRVRKKCNVKKREKQKGEGNDKYGVEREENEEVKSERKRNTKK